jgi:hypothetical protein
MKKSLLFYLVILLVTFGVSITEGASSAYRHQDQVTTIRGDAIGGASVAVYLAGTSNLATLYSGASTGTSTISNPTYTDVYGRFFFYATPGTYDILISGAGVTQYLMEDVEVSGFDSWTGNSALADTSWISIMAPGYVSLADGGPILQAYDGVPAYVFDSSDSLGFMPIRLPDGYISGEDILLRVRHTLNTATDTDTLRWRLSYFTASPGAPFTALSSSLISTFCDSMGAGYHLASENDTISGTSLLPGDLIWGKVRYYEAVVGYSGECPLLGIEARIPVNKLGSGSE